MRTLAGLLLVCAAAATAQAQMGPPADVMMRKMDSDRDGRISRREWRGPAKGFDHNDKNGDGFIVRQELAGDRKRTGGAPAFVDVHTHIFEDITTTMAERLTMDFTAAADQAIAHMDKYDVRVSVIMPTPGVKGLFGSDVLLAQAKRHPRRFVVLGGGGKLNPMVHATPAAEVTEEVKRRFEDLAEGILRDGAIGFGEMAALHFSYSQNHPFEQVQPDHPLLLLLADIAARHDVPIDLHCEIAPTDLAVSPKLIARSGKNPRRVDANLAALERLLAHNIRARIILSHSIDATGFRTAEIIRGLLERHPNMMMSLNVFSNYLIAENLPLKIDGKIAPDWQDLIRDHPDRFMIGSDQRYSSPCSNCKLVDRVGPSRRWLALLPDEIAHIIAIENPRRTFRLKSVR